MRGGFVRGKGKEGRALKGTRAVSPAGCTVRRADGRGVVVLGAPLRFAAAELRRAQAREGSRGRARARLGCRIQALESVARGCRRSANNPIQFYRGKLLPDPLWSWPNRARKGIADLPMVD